MAMDYRKIIHIDMDAFFASVEQRDHPELRGKPIAVGGSGRRGVVAAASYEARKYGVRSAMPGYMARERCPELIFVRHRFSVYKEVSQQIREIFLRYTDLIEPLSLDEAFLDVTENKVNINSGTIIAERIRAEIFQETRLTASAGVSFNKFLAKVASDLNKPNGIAVITPEEAPTFLDELPIEKFFGIGKATARKMHRLNIKVGKDLKEYSKIELAQKFGKSGIWYYHVVRAEDNRPVRSSRVRKSVGAERTFSEDVTSIQDMLHYVRHIAEDVYERLIKHGRFGRTLTLKIKYSDFQTITRSISYPSEVSEKDFLIKESEQLVRENLNENDKIRLLGISVTNLTVKPLYGEQLELEFPIVQKKHTPKE